MRGTRALRREASIDFYIVRSSQSEAYRGGKAEATRRIVAYVEDADNEANKGRRMNADCA